MMVLRFILDLQMVFVFVIRITDFKINEQNLPFYPYLAAWEIMPDSSLLNELLQRRVFFFINCPYHSGCVHVARQFPLHLS